MREPVTTTVSGVDVLFCAKAGCVASKAETAALAASNVAVLVAPPAKFHAFDKLLKTESIDKKPRGNNAFWARYPFMTDAEIDAEVSAY